MIATNEQTRNWFYSKTTKEEFAQDLVKADKKAFIDIDGLARCKRCKAPRMFLLDGVFGGAYCHKWLPIACECKDEPLKEYVGDCPFDEVMRA